MTPPVSLSYDEFRDALMSSSLAQQIPENTNNTKSFSRVYRWRSDVAPLSFSPLNQLEFDVPVDECASPVAVVHPSALRLSWTPYGYVSGDETYVYDVELEELLNELTETSEDSSEATIEIEGEYLSEKRRESEADEGVC